MASYVKVTLLAVPLVRFTNSQLMMRVDMYHQLSEQVMLHGKSVQYYQVPYCNWCFALHHLTEALSMTGHPGNQLSLSQELCSAYKPRQTQP